MGVNSLPKTVTRQRRDCDLNPGPSAPESSTLTTRLPSHPALQLGIRLQMLGRPPFPPRPQGVVVPTLSLVAAGHRNTTRAAAAATHWPPSRCPHAVLVIGLCRRCAAAVTLDSERRRADHRVV